MTKFNRGNLRGAKLSNEQVFEMRRLYEEERWSQRELAQHYHLSVNHVGRIVRGESRQGVPSRLPDEDHAAAQKRLLAIQEGRAADSIQQTLDQVKIERPVDKQLEELTNWPEASKFGVIKGDSR